MDGSEINNVKFKLSGRLTALDVGRYRAEWRTDFGVGSWTGLRTEYYRPLAGTGWFVAPSALYERVQGSLFQEDARLAEYQLNR